MAHKAGEPKHEDSPTLHQISLALRDSNHEAVLDMANLLLQQKQSLHATVSTMKHDLQRIKNASHQLNTKLNTLQHRPSPSPHSQAQAQISSNEWHELFAIQHSIEASVMNMMTSTANTTTTTTIVPRTGTGMPSSSSPSHPQVHHSSSSSRSSNGNNNNDVNDDDKNGHGHGRVFYEVHDGDINELSQTHTMTVTHNGDRDHEHPLHLYDRDRDRDRDDESSMKTEAMSICTDSVYPGQLHERRGSTSNLSDSKHDQDSSDIASKLECGGRIVSLIKKSERKRCSKSTVIAFIQDLGVSTAKIEQAYADYFAQNHMYEMTFAARPLGFAVLKDENGCNAIVTSIQNADKFKQTPLRIGSIIYEINGKRVDQRKHDKIVQLLMTTPCPFDIIFKMDEGVKPYVNSHKLQKLHEHSMISSTSMDTQEVVHDTKVMIDWEQIGQILLDQRYLTTARLINQALDHLETFCIDEDLHEHNIRDELCKAWSVEDDRGMVLWQILHGHLKYSIPERKWFYDLILHQYFKLENMTTVNVYFLLTKILRDMQVKHVNLVHMKEVLIRNKITGFSFNNASAEIQSADEFVRLFKCMENVDEEIWEKVYAELVEWHIDEERKLEHKNHQRQFRNRQAQSGDNEHQAHADGDGDGDGDADAFAVNGHENEVTLFQDLTKLSIRNDIEYSNSEENRAWKRYRHHLKNIFRFFAGYNASMMRRKELRRFLDVCDIKEFWSPHLLQEDTISMDQFIKYLCNEHVNSKVRAIRAHIESQKEWAMLLNAAKCLEDIDAEGNKEGLLELYDFQKFGQYFDLDEQETRDLFRKIDKRDVGKITIDEVFEWFKKQLLHKQKQRDRKHRSQHRHHRKRRKAISATSAGSWNSSNSQKENSCHNKSSTSSTSTSGTDDDDDDDDGHECIKSPSSQSQTRKNDNDDNRYKTQVKIIRKEKNVSSNGRDRGRKNSKHSNSKSNGKYGHQIALQDSKPGVHAKEESLTVDVD